MAASDAGLRQRLIPESENLPDDWDPSLPYGGKVYLARKKKPDPTYVKVIEASLKMQILVSSSTCDVYWLFIISMKSKLQKI